MKFNLSFFILLFLMVFMISCKTAKPPGKQVTETENVTYVIKDSIIREPGDTVKLVTKIPCPDADWQGETKGSKTKLTASLKNGTLQINCETDSLMKRIQWLEKNTERIKEVTIFQEVKVPDPYIPKWVWYTLLLFSSYTVYSCRKQLFPLFSKVVKLFT